MFILPFLGGLIAVAQAAVATAIEWALTSAIIGGLIGGGIGAGSEIVPAIRAGEDIQVERAVETGIQGAAQGAIGGAASGAILGAAAGGIGAAVGLARNAHLAANAAKAANACAQGCVYAIKHETLPNVVKLGYTTNPANRLPGLVSKYETAPQFSFLKPVSNGIKAEKALHQTHKASQVTRGVVGKEFFALDDIAVAKSFSF